MHLVGAQFSPNTGCVRLHFWALSCVLLVCKSVFMPVPHHFDYYSFVTSFEIRNCEISNFILLFQDWFGYVFSI